MITCSSLLISHLRINTTSDYGLFVLYNLIAFIRFPLFFFVRWCLFVYFPKTKSLRTSKGWRKTRWEQTTCLFNYLHRRIYWKTASSLVHTRGYCFFHLLYSFNFIVIRDDFSSLYLCVFFSCLLNTMMYTMMFNNKKNETWFLFLFITHINIYIKNIVILFGLRSVWRCDCLTKRLRPLNVECVDLARINKTKYSVKCLKQLSK